MKVIMTGGGTGGHIYPAVAIADKIKEKNPGAEILFIGTKRGMEKDLVPNSGYDIKFITVSGFNRKHLMKNVKTVRDYFIGKQQAKRIIQAFKPDMVIGTGGYVCGPTVKIAAKKGIPTFIHEQNAFPGVTNKMLSKFVDRVFISFPDASKYFKTPEKLIETGNPIRKEFLEISYSEARKKLGIPQNEFTVLSFGGSLGAEKINVCTEALIKEMAEDVDFRAYFVTGVRQHEKYKEEMKPLTDANDRIQVLKYINNMPLYINAADLIICRAGALTVSEITACGKASIMIPSPYVTGNHQYFNAKVAADVGGSILIEQKDLTSDSLIKEVRHLKENPEALRKMQIASRSVGKLDAAEIIYENLK